MAPLPVEAIETVYPESLGGGGETGINGIGPSMYTSGGGIKLADNI